MTTETDRTIAQHGAEAVDLRQHPAFRRAMDALRDQVQRQWRATSVHDTKEQAALLQLAKAADKVELILVQMAKDGEAAVARIRTDELRDESKPRALLRRVGMR